MAEVKSAQVTISEFWPDHVHHKTVGKAPRWDTELGVVCACAEVLGWPDPERKETLSAYTRRVASEQVDAASAAGRVKGAFGTYGGERPEPAAEGEGIRSEPGVQVAATKAAGHWPVGATENPVDVREPGDYPEPEQQEPPRSDDDPGPDEPEPEVDWGEPPADEPEPEVLTIEDGDSEDVGSAPIPADAVPDERGNMISGGMSYGQADEAQAAPWGSKTTPVEPPRWEGVDDTPEHAVGDQVIVAGTTFTKVSDDPFPPEIPSNEGIPTEEIGRDLVPYAGTPIMPTEAEVLDPLIGRLAPLDPTLPYTPADVELKIVEILRQLENSELFLRQQLARLHQATHNYNMRYNLAYKSSDGRSDGQRKADAVLATERESYEMTEADMLVRALRDSQHNLRAQLSGFQSVARSLAVSMVNSLDGRERPPLPPEPPRWT